MTLSYAFVYPEGYEQPWAHSVRPMALALAKTVSRESKPVKSSVL